MLQKNLNELLGQPIEDHGYIIPKAGSMKKIIDKLDLFKIKYF